MLQTPIRLFLELKRLAFTAVDILGQYRSGHFVELVDSQIRIKRQTIRSKGVVAKFELHVRPLVFLARMNRDVEVRIERLIYSCGDLFSRRLLLLAYMMGVTLTHGCNEHHSRSYLSNWNDFVGQHEFAEMHGLLIIIVPFFSRQKLTDASLH